MGRVATAVAVAALLANAGLLGAAGLVAGRPVLLVAAAGLLVAAGAVVAAWRRHRRTLASLAEDRQALRDEVLEMRRLVRRRPE